MDVKDASIEEALSEFFTEGSKTIDSYEKLDKIGEGTFGGCSKVYKARDIETGEIVALKKFRLDTNAPKEEFPYTAIHEVKTLRKLNHENVIKLKETMKTLSDYGNKNKGGIYIVFEYMEHDLAGLLLQPQWSKSLTTPQIKLLTGLHYCHVNEILHCDIKAANLLINNEGILKIADFGLSRSINGIPSDQNLTNELITVCYRPPELLLGGTEYGPAVDIWSAGCILAELLNRKSIFPGKTEADTLNHIFELCGAPDDTNWPGVSDLPLYTLYKPSRPMPRHLGEVYQHFEKDALDLLEKMLSLDPNQRISAKDALDADYFCTDPLPSDPKSLPKFESSHFYEVKKKRKPNMLRLKSPIQQMMPLMPPPKSCYASQPASSSLHPHSSRPYSPPPPSRPLPPRPPRPRKRPSVGYNGGYGSYYRSRDMPRFGSQGASGSGSKYESEAPNCPQRYGLSYESRDGSSSSSHGGADSGSAYEGGAPSQPQGDSLKRKQSDSQKSE